MKIAVVGTGYVGLVSGVCLAEVGHTVTCVDTDVTKVEKLRKAQSPIYEPGLDALLKRNIEHERLSFTTQLPEALRGALAVFIAVGTPQGEDGSADLKYVLGVAEAIGKHAENDMLVIVKSTVPVGTCDRVEATLNEQLRQRGSRLKLSVASNPEFLKEGSAIDDFMRPDRIIAGAVDTMAADTLREMYRPFILDDPGKLYIMDRRSSELTKYGANAMLATRISFMNELSRLCDEVGANVDHIRLGMGLDARIGRKFLYAGPGYGGSCFPKDVAALLRTGEDHGVDLSVLKAVTRANEAQKLYVAEKIQRFFAEHGGLKGSRIAFWGLAFKPGTDDVREAPAKTIARFLLDHGASVVAHDPEGCANFAKEFGSHDRLNYAKSAYSAIEGADALVLLTEWSEYRRPNFDKIKTLMRRPAIFDFRNQYSREMVEKAGFFYDSVGRPVISTGSR